MLLDVRYWPYSVGDICSGSFCIPHSIGNVLLNNQRGIKNEGKCNRGNFNYVIHLSVSEKKPVSLISAD